MGLELLSLLVREVATMAVVSLNGTFLCNLLFSKPFEPFRCTVAVVGLSHVNELLCILLIDCGPFALDVWTIGTAYNRAFVPLHAKPIKRVIQILKGLVAVAFAVCVLYSEYELTPA